VFVDNLNKTRDIFILLTLWNSIPPGYPSIR